MHSRALHIGTRFFPHRQRFWVIKKIDTDLFQQDIRIVFNQLQVLFAEVFEIGNFALDKRRGFNHRIGTSFTAPFTATTLSTCSSSPSSFQS